MVKTNIQISKDSKINIQISRDVQAKIREQGRMHEDYSEVIQRLIKELVELRKKGDRR